MSYSPHHMVRSLPAGDDKDAASAHRRYGAEGCSGYRLVLDKEALRRVLRHSKMDLLVEITLTRSTKEHSIGDDDQEEPSEAEFDLLVVLRRDGGIEFAGPWHQAGAPSRLREFA